MNKSFQKINKKLVASGLAIYATASQAAVTYDAAAGTFGGSIETSAYTSAIPITIAVIALVIATTLGIKALKGAKSA